MWGLWNWAWNMLYSWGLANKSGKLLFLGLDNAGKTTLLHMLRDNRLVQHTPTRNPTSETLTMGHVSFRTYDLGGHREARRLWKDYFGADVSGIIYLIDATDQARLEESRVELNALLSDKDTGHVPFLVLGNKIDVETAMSEPQMREYLGLIQTTGKGTIPLPDDVRPIEVFMCSVAQRTGYGEGFKWISQYI